LIISEDFSLNNRLLVGGDVSLNSRLTVYNDVSFNNRVFIGRDVSMNGNLYTFGKTILNNDVSMNGNLTVSNIITCNELIINSGSTNTSGFLFSDLITASGGIISTSDATMNNRLFVSNDTSMNGNLYVANFSRVNHITEFINVLTYSAIITVPYAKDYYYITSATANFTLNFTGFPTDANQAFFCTLYINASAGRFFCNAVQIGGVSRTLLYPGGIGTASTTMGTTCTFAMQTFNFVNAGGSAPIAIISNIYPYQ
jgi:hypothetical protein